MNRPLVSPGFQPSQIKEQLCLFWCHEIDVQVIDGALAIETPSRWPDDDPIYVYLEEDDRGNLVLTDWHQLLGELYIQGIHSCSALVSFAASRGFVSDKRGELRRYLSDLADLPAAVLDYLQIAGIALAEMEHIRFEPAPLVLPVTWGSILTKNIVRQGVELRSIGSKVYVDKKRIVRSGTVAIHNNSPIVVSPFIRCDNRGWADMAALFQDAVPTLCGIVPLVKSKNDSSFSEFRLELKDAAKRHVRDFFVDAVPVYAGEDKFDVEKNIYPGVAVLSERISPFAQVLDNVLGGLVA